MSLEFDKYAVVSNDGVYYWNADSKSLLDVIEKSETCFKTLNLQRLKKQFSLLKNVELSDSFEDFTSRTKVTGPLQLEGSKGTFHATVYFKLNEKTGFVEDYKIQAVIDVIDKQTQPE